MGVPYVNSLYFFSLIYFMEMMEKRVRVNCSRWSADYTFIKDEESNRVGKEYDRHTGS